MKGCQIFISALMLDLVSEKRLNKFQFTSSNCSDLIGVLKLEWFSLWESLPPSSNTKEKETINPTSEFSQLLLKYFERFLFLWLFLFQYEIRLFVLPCFFVTRQMAFPGTKLLCRLHFWKFEKILFFSSQYSECDNLQDYRFPNDVCKCQLLVQLF